MLTSTQTHDSIEFLGHKFRIHRIDGTIREYDIHEVTDVSCETSRIFKCGILQIKLTNGTKEGILYGYDQRNEFEEFARMISPRRFEPAQKQQNIGVMTGAKLGCGMFIIFPSMILAGFIVLINLMS
jgi:hypothetical protein